MFKVLRPLDLIRVREVFDYDPDTGLLTWNLRSSNRIKVGDVAGGVNPEGYIQVGFDGQRRLGHHIAWVWWYGKLPVGDVDHINRCRTDNRVVNLRDVPRTENLLNGQYTNSTGYQGVMQVPSGKFRAAIHVNRVCKYIGTFSTAEEAGAAYAAAHRNLYGRMSRFHPEHPNPHPIDYGLRMAHADLS